MGLYLIYTVRSLALFEAGSPGSTREEEGQPPWRLHPPGQLRKRAIYGLEHVETRTERRGAGKSMSERGREREQGVVILLLVRIRGSGMWMVREEMQQEERRNSSKRREH